MDDLVSLFGIAVAVAGLIAPFYIIPKIQDYFKQKNPKPKTNDTEYIVSVIVDSLIKDSTPPCTPTQREEIIRDCETFIQPIKGATRADKVNRKFYAGNKEDAFVMINSVVAYHTSNFKKIVPLICKNENIPLPPEADIKFFCFKFWQYVIYSKSKDSLHSFPSAFIKEFGHTRQQASQKAPKSDSFSPQNWEEEIHSIIKKILDIIIRNISDMDESSFPELSEAAFEVEEFGVIKQKATSRLDYAIFIFFNLYCSLGTPNNEKFIIKYAEIYEKVLKEYFSNEIQSASLLNAIFDSRLISYDSIMRTSEDKDGDLIYQIAQFIAKDLWLNEPLAKEWYIAGITKELSLKMEITLLYRLIFDEIKPLYKELADLSRKQ